MSFMVGTKICIKTLFENCIYNHKECLFLIACSRLGRTFIQGANVWNHYLWWFAVRAKAVLQAINIGSWTVLRTQILNSCNWFNKILLALFTKSTSIQSGPFKNCKNAKKTIKFHIRIETNLNSTCLNVCWNWWVTLWEALDIVKWLGWIHVLCTSFKQVTSNFSVTTSK